MKRCIECNEIICFDDSEYEIKQIEHRKWQHQTNEEIKREWSSLLRDFVVVESLVKDDKWFEAYVESADFYDRFLLALKGVRKASDMGS